MATYGKARNLAREQQQARDLRSYLSTKFGGTSPTFQRAGQNWSDLVNAVSYGGYTAQDIANYLTGAQRGKAPFDLSKSRGANMGGIPDEVYKAASGDTSPDTADNTYDYGEAASKVWEDEQKTLLGENLTAAEQAKDTSLSRLNEDTGTATTNLNQDYNRYVSMSDDLKNTWMSKEDKSLANATDTAARGYQAAKNLYGQSGIVANKISNVQQSDTQAKVDYLKNWQNQRDTKQTDFQRQQAALQQKQARSTEDINTQYETAKRNYGSQQLSNMLQGTS